MKKIFLVEATSSYKKEIGNFKAAFPADTNKIEGSSDLAASPSIDKWLTSLEQLRSPTTPSGKVPGIQFLAIDEDQKIIGMLNLRLRLNDYLLNFGGHIGYAIRPDERKQGYGTKVLALGLQEAKKNGIKRILVTCKETNQASARVIEKNYGRLEDKRLNHEKQLMRRYWIVL
ncbi:GNAT family N-acetyltransferase [Enterococcus sp. JM9B]|uniref:GNAT family N-acetyltransferase n=1 Tax=Enterococcus sp. JM9B TaxID=1857216 RepID=UPI00137518FF|nr:GNAT family N-acetyltransferase [Enterococcus sp. JM9B]